ncbi:MAG TPA: hypothetical protein VGG99_09395 [Acetobacteraceae bacterium]|jgi:hypothetical protein
MGRADKVAAIFDHHGQVVEQARRLVETSRLHSGAIAAEISATRASLAASRALLVRTDRVVAAGRTQTGVNVPGRSFAAVTELVRQIERGTAREVEPINALIAQIKSALRSDTDRGVLIGILMEGAAQAIRQIGQQPERRDMLSAALVTLRERSDSAGERQG